MIKKAVLQLHRDTLFRNSFYLMLATGVMAAFGFFFWLITARLYTTTNIGLATTLISVMNLIATLSLIGFNAAFVRFLPVSTNKNDQMNTGLVLVSIAAGILSFLFIVLVGSISPQLIFIQQDPLYGSLFVIACVMTALNILTDSIFLSGKQAKYTLIIDAIFSVFKMLAPLAFIGWGAIGIFTAAALAQTLGTVLSILVMIWRFEYRPSFAIRWEVLSSVWQYCAANYLAGVFNLLPATFFPIIVINNLGPDPAAYYYIAMMIANLLYAIPYATTKSFFAEGSHDESSLGNNLGKSIKIMAFLLVPSMAILFFGAGLILHVFGKSYASEGVAFLQILVIASIAVSAYSLTNALFQVQKNIRAIIVVNIVFAASAIALAYQLLWLGLIGIGIAWTGGNIIAGIVGYVLYQWGGYLYTKWDNITHQPREILVCKFQFLRAWARNGFRSKVILFYPEKPRTWHLLYPICHMLGYTISNDPDKRFDRAIAFSDITVRKEDPVLDELSEHHQLINAHCGDISKTHVEKVFQEVFGYGMAIDPRTYSGRYVKKSDANGVHDGVILDVPSEPQKGYIYQKLIDSESAVGELRDIRTFIFKDTIPFTLYRYKSADDRFDNTVRAEWVDTDAAFTKEEQAKIFRFCERLGLDYGELDILRDKNDGRIYIVDANNTPSGPRRGIQMPEEEYDKFITTLASSFDTTFLHD